MRANNKDLINNLNIESNIDYKEKLSRAELLSCLNEADIGISASLYEGFGFPLVEMISSELPVLVANKGSLPELAGNAGIIFDAERASSLAEKMPAFGPVFSKRGLNHLKFAEAHGEGGRDCPSCPHTSSISVFMIVRQEVWVSVFLYRDFFRISYYVK